MVSGEPGRGAPASDSRAPGRPGAGEVWGARSLRPLGRWACALFYSACSLPAAAAVASGGWGLLEGGAPAVSLGAAASPALPLQGTVGVRGGRQSGLRGLRAQAEGWESGGFVPPGAGGGAGSRWVLICMPTGARARDRAVVYLCVYSPTGWEAKIGGYEEWIWVPRGAGLGVTWVLFLFEKPGGLFFLDWT